MAIRGDSKEYDLLKRWCETSKLKSPLDKVQSGMTCEIGVREGLGSKIILESFNPICHHAVDPYGNLEYQHYDDGPAYTCDYTDAMYRQMLIDFSEYDNFLPWKMTDTRYMQMFHHITHYDFVHFDGPHMTRDVLREAIWFADRSDIGTRFVFDDYPKYDMNLITHVLMKWGFKQHETGENKLCLEKVM